MDILNLVCPLFLTTNDGCIITAEQAEMFPIRTFASGPTNSMRGASFLAGLDMGPGERKDSKPIIVVDVGGTTTGEI